MEVGCGGGDVRVARSERAPSRIYVNGKIEVTNCENIGARGEAIVTIWACISG